jgi:hypothetical protein
MLRWLRYTVRQFATNEGESQMRKTVLTTIAGAALIAGSGLAAA